MIFAIREQSSLHAVCAFAAMLTVAIVFFSFHQSPSMPLLPQDEQAIDISNLPVLYPTDYAGGIWTSYSGMNGAVNGSLFFGSSFEPTNRKDVWKDDSGQCYHLYPGIWKFEDGSSWKATPRGPIRTN